VSSELLDLNLKAAHDSRYDPSTLVAGSIVEFIITSGVLISASNTSNYALTNPNTWPSGVFIRLIIESGAVVAGRGGDGGDGGYDVTKTLGINPTSGGNGGDGLFVDYPIDIENLGIITGGGGAGGGSGAGRYYRDGGTIWNWIDGLGGGGGWPYGAAGSNTLVTFGPASPLPTTATNATTTDAGTGGTGSTIFVTGSRSIVVGDGGDGGKYSNGIGGVNAVVTNYSDNAGVSIVQQSGAIGGQRGDAIHGNAFITWVNTGTRYGAII